MDGMQNMSEILKLLTKFATIGGGVLLLWGGIGIGTNLKDHNGPAISNGTWQMVGGGLIIAAAQLFSNIAL